MARWTFRRRKLLEDTSGLATIEFAVCSTALVLGLMNGVEFARWYYQKMEVANAVHAAAHAAWNACDTKHLPAKTNCTGLDAAIISGLQSTSLGAAVTPSTATSEGYYCLTTAGALKKEVDYTGTKPSNCSAESDSSHSPGDYLVVSGQATFTPMFSNSLTFGRVMPTTLTATSMIRLQ